MNPETNKADTRKFKITPSPHLKAPFNVRTIMYLVVIGLIPALGGAIHFYGWYSLWLVLISVGTAVAAELLMNLAFKRPLLSCLDGSAIITGMLLAYNVPPTVPLWIPAAGSAFAIIIVKALFGGLGHNFLNPALAGRAFLMASWPGKMTSGWILSATSGLSAKWALEGSVSGVGSAKLAETLSSAPPADTVLAKFASTDTLFRGAEVVSGATPLDLAGQVQAVSADTAVYESGAGLLNDPETLRNLFFGKMGGVLGETSALLLLIPAILLIIMRVIDWRIPLAYIGTVALGTLVAWLFKATPVTPIFHLLSGGMMLGALFMATDYSTSPVTRSGQWIFGIGCGVLTVLIRLWSGGFPEGVSYSILLMNVATPLIDRVTRPRILGESRKKKKKEKK